MLQVCRTMGEAEDLLKMFADSLFPENSGAVYLYRSSRNLLEKAVGWGNSTQIASLEPEECWGLRCGEAYSLNSGEPRPKCRHLNDERPGSTAGHVEPSGLSPHRC